MTQLKLVQYKLICENPEQKSKDIAIVRGRDGVGTKYAYGFTDTFLIIPDGDFQGLTLQEIQSLTPYEEK